MYYILYEGLKIESNEPVYCIQCTVYTVHCILYNIYFVSYTMYNVLDVHCIWYPIHRRLKD